MAIDEGRRLDAGVEQHLRDFCSTLSEKDRRRFAAIEARQFGCDPLNPAVYAAIVSGVSQFGLGVGGSAIW